VSTSILSQLIGVTYLTGKRTPTSGHKRVIKLPPFLCPRESRRRCSLQHPGHCQIIGVFPHCSLIVNKMIGTGIFTTPATVLFLTGNAQLSLGLWAVGFFYTIMSTQGHVHIRSSTSGICSSPSYLVHPIPTSPILLLRNPSQTLHPPQAILSLSMTAHSGSCSKP